MQRPAHLPAQGLVDQLVLLHPRLAAERFGNHRRALISRSISFAAIAMATVSVSPGAPQALSYAARHVGRKPAFEAVGQVL